MRLTFSDILDDDFENKIKKIKNKVKKVFNKKEHYLIYKLSKEDSILIYLLLAVLTIFFILINLGFLILVLPFLIILNLSFSINYNSENNKTGISNISRYYGNKQKKVNAAKVRAMVSGLDTKEKEMINIINEKKIIGSRALRIKNEILESKIKESSILEIEKNESQILDYINNIKDTKKAKSIKKLMNKRLEEKDIDLFDSTNGLTKKKKIKNKNVLLSI